MSIFLRKLAIFLSIVLISTSFVVSAHSSFAATAINRQFTYQGRLLDSAGVAVADGTYSIIFSLYDVAAGSTPIWTAKGTTGTPTAVSVPVSNGLFSVNLGDVTAGQNAFDISWHQDLLYLGVTVGTDSEMTPRKRLASVPYAFVAETLQGQYATASVASTGGTLFSLTQTATDAASGARTALLVSTSGTSNTFDFLIKAFSGSDVFTVTRQGNVTVAGTQLTSGVATFASNVLPSVDNSSRLGSSAARWAGLDAVNTTSTNATSTNFYAANGTMLDGTFTNITATGTTSLQSLSLLNGTSTAWFGFATASGTTLNTLTANAANFSSPNVTITGGTMNGTTIGLSSAASAIFSNATSTNWFGFATASGTTLNALSLSGASLTSPNATISGGTLNGVSIGALSPSTAAFSNATSGNLAFTSGSGTSLTIAGQQVCLADGTNCTVGGGLSGSGSADRVMVWSGASSATSSVNFMWDATNTRLGVGTSTPAQTLDVNGSIANILSPNQSFRIMATGTTDVNPVDIKVVGRYAYVLTGSSSTLQIFDVSSAIEPLLLSTLTMPAGVGTPNRLVVSGRYVYVAGEGTDVVSIDISNPTSPVVMGTVTGTTLHKAIAISGKFVYTVSWSGNYFEVFDFSDPTNPVLVKQKSIGSMPLSGLAIDGRYAYVVNTIASNSLFVLDLSNPRDPVIIGQVSTSIVASDVVAQNGYAYISSSGGKTLTVVDVRNPVSPIKVKTISTGLTSWPQYLSIQGRYIYAALSGDGMLGVIDIASSTNPVLLTGSIPVGTSPYGVAVSGRYAYVTNSDSTTGNSFTIVDINGIETNGLSAQSAEFGTAQIFTDAMIGGRLSVGNALDVGYGGIYSQGGLSIGGTSSYSNVIGNFVIGSGASSTAPFFFARPGGDLTLSRMYVGPTANADLVIGATTSSGMHAQFQLTGDDLFVAGNIGSASSVYTNGEFITGAGSTHLNDGNLFKTDGALSLFSTGGDATLKTVGSGNVVINPVASGAGTLNFGAMLEGDTANFYATPSFHAYIGSGLEPSASNLYNLGSGSRMWQNIYTSGTASLTGFGKPLDVHMASAGADPAMLVYKECDAFTGGYVAQFNSNLGSSNVPVARLSCEGNWTVAGANSGGGADYAEYWHTLDTDISPGDVVSIGSTKTDIEKSGSAQRDEVLGVISTKPGFIGNAGETQLSDPTHWKVVGQLGLVPVKADATSDPIVAGDLLMAGSNGRAIKAHGVGKILGRALESLASGLGTIEMYVKPEWSASDVFAADTNKTNILSQGTATALNPAFDSMGLSFIGSAWNIASSTAVAVGFTLSTDIQGVETSEFSISNLGGSKLLTISNVGDVSVTGDLSVGHRLFLGSKSGGIGSTSTYLFVDDTQAPASTYIATNADGWSTATTYDYAERFASTEDLKPGDVVMTDADGSERVMRSKSSSDVVLGIVSTKPGFITGANSTGTFPIALAGRVPTRVSAKNGAIMAGDQLAPSDMPGVAVKATGSGSVIGVALENYSGAGEGRISVFVQPGWKGGEIVAKADAPASFSYHVSAESISSPRSGLALIAAGSKEVRVEFATLNAYPLVTVTPYGQTSNGWWLTNVSDHGFTIIVGEAPSFDLTFAWKAEASHEGNVISNSDGTSVTYDALTGKPVMNATTSTQDTVVETATSTPEVAPIQTPSTTTTTEGSDAPVIEEIVITAESSTTTQ